jgi:epoxyqueuosine reductase
MVATADLAAHARGLGFELVGVCRPEPGARDAAAYQAWVAAGMAGEMAYMARPDRVARATDPALTLPTVRSLIVVGKGYRTGGPAREARTDPSRGVIASYAWGGDYHDAMLPRVRTLGEWLAAELGRPVAARAYVDTGPVLERDAARRAGLGFVGRNTMLIHPRRGSWLFLGGLLVDVELEAGSPSGAGTCGRCARCLEACPTVAFPAPYVLDARRCISYLTIELKGPIPRELRPGIGNRIFGCDVCNEVCPYNRRLARRTGDPELQPGPDRAAPRLAELIALDEAGFRALYSGTPVARCKRRGLLRNACVAMGNWADAEAAPALTVALSDHEPLVRGHAAWALGQVGTSSARAALERAREREPEPWVRGEVELALEESSRT